MGNRGLGVGARTCSFETNFTSPFPETNTGPNGFSPEVKSQQPTVPVRGPCVTRLRRWPCDGFENFRETAARVFFFFR